MWGKFVEQGHSVDDIMVHALACWIPKVTKTHSQCNTYCFSTATFVA